MDKLQAAKKLTGVSWNIRGDKLEQAEDGSPRIPVPSDADIQTCIDTDPLAYQEKRVNEYPPLADQLDALWKGEPYTSQMRQQILAIKTKYPK